MFFSGFWKKIGKFTGSVTGGLIGGSIKLGGKAVGTKFEKTGIWLEELGDGVKGASVQALSNAGQLIDGGIYTATGIMKDDEVLKEKGKEDVKDVAAKTIRGVTTTVKYTASGISESYQGIRDGDNEQAINGLKNVGKVVAVSVLAVGVVDLFAEIDDVNAVESTSNEAAITQSLGQVQSIETTNEDLAGQVHMVTAVPFESKVIDLPNGTTIEGVFPLFESNYSAFLAQSDYLASDQTQFAMANEQLSLAIQENPFLATEIGLTNNDLIDLTHGETPEGFTWHHSENPGELQLVSTEDHSKTAHDGGRSLWGGGEEFRS